MRLSEVERSARIPGGRREGKTVPGGKARGLHLVVHDPRRRHAPGQKHRIAARRLLPEHGQRENIVVAAGNDEIRSRFADQPCNACEIRGAGCGRRNEVCRVAAEVAGRLGNAVRADNNAALAPRTERIDDILRREASGTQKQQAQFRFVHSEAPEEFVLSPTNP